MKMNFLDHPPEVLFFTGKGGVGKTSLSCAASVYLAGLGKKVLLVSTDPASNIGQVFGQEIGNQITALCGVEGLFALEIDPVDAARKVRERIVGPVRGVLPDAVVRGIEEQLSGACTVEIAAFGEFTELLTDKRVLSEFDHVLFDTAPTGHTIRLLSLPGAWSSFINDNPQGASCLGPLAGLEKQKGQYEESVKILSDPYKARLVLVARGQESSLQEVLRTASELRMAGVASGYLVINGLLPQSEVKDDPLALAIYQSELRTIKKIEPLLREFKVDRLPLKEYNIVGIDHLKAFFSDRDESFCLPPGVSDLKSNPSFSDPLLGLGSMIDDLSKTDHGLVMMVGKGGVGKTTMAAAIALGLSRRGFSVHLTTTDPAAHLLRTLPDAPSTLTISRIDPEEETRRYRKLVLEENGKGLDKEGLLMLEEDLRSPCTEEIAVFQAFSRVIEESDRKFVVVDTAPTGHTLLLLDATGAYHREVTRHKKGESQETTALTRLQDPEKTKIILVSLLETTPVLESMSLESDLLRAGIQTWGWIFNNTLSAGKIRSPLLKERARSEQILWEKTMKMIQKPVVVVGMQESEPLGEMKLLEMSQERSTARN